MKNNLLHSPRQHKTVLIKSLSSLDWHQLIYDIGLILYTEFFLYSFIANDGWLYQRFGITYLVIAAIGASFMLMWFTGMILFRYIHGTKNKVIPWIVGAYCTWLICTLPIFMAINVGGLFPEDSETVAGITGISILICGFLYGFIFMITEFVRQPGESILMGRIYFLRRIGMFPLGYIAWLLVIAGPIWLKRFGYSGPTAFLISLISASTIVGIPAFVFFRLEKYLKAKNKDRFVPEGHTYHFFKRYIFPLLIIPVLCLCEEIYLFGKINSASLAGEAISKGEMIFHLFLTGVIPLRILVVLTPPIKIFHVLTGVFSIGYLIYYSLKLLP